MSRPSGTLMCPDRAESITSVRGRLGRHLGIGTLCRHPRRREQAHEHLVTATTMYREMGMRFWVEQAEAELKEHG
jgi:hypothetical protein